MFLIDVYVDKVFEWFCLCMYGIKLLILEFLEILFFDSNFVMLFLFGKEENKFIEFIRFVNWKWMIFIRVYLIVYKYIVFL